jgi:hypothetical protein
MERGKIIVKLQIRSSRLENAKILEDAENCIDCELEFQMCETGANYAPGFFPKGILLLLLFVLQLLGFVILLKSEGERT